MIPSADTTYHNSTGEILEVEVFYKVIFKIRTWDGVVKEHEADLPGHVLVKHLKEDLRDELGDPDLSEWVVDKNGLMMSDEKVIYNNYHLQHNDQVNVFIHKPRVKRG